LNYTRTTTSPDVFTTFPAYEAETRSCFCSQADALHAPDQILYFLEVQHLQHLQTC